MVLKKEVYNYKFREGENKINVEYSIVDDKDAPEEFGRMARIEFLDEDGCEWGVIVIQKIGIHFKMPRKFFEKQLEDTSANGLEFTFTVPESDALIDLIRLYQKGSSYLKEMKKNQKKKD